MSEETKEKKALTPEEIEAGRKKAIDYYTKQIEILTLQAKQESLMAEIEVHRAKRIEMIIRQAQMAAGPEDPDNHKKIEGQAEIPQPDKKRILKKEE